MRADESFLRSLGVQMKALVLVNPVAGGGRARRVMPDVAAYLREQGYVAEFAESRDGADLERRAGEAARAGYNPIVMAGGDGAVQHVARAMMGLGATLGIIPLGGGNDVAAALGIPADPIDAAHLLVRGKARPMDVVGVRLASGKETLYLGGGGMGLDAESAGLANTRFRNLPGAARYVAGALWTLRRFRAFRAEIALDGEAAFRSEPLLLAAVTNTPFYGGRIRIAPEALVDDGVLDLVLVHAMPWQRLVELIPVALATGRLGPPEILRYRARRIRLSADRPVLFHGDGEVFGESPMDLECLPGAIRVLAPPTQ
jgi:diacylglycerol kinase (ATP)